MFEFLGSGILGSLLGGAFRLAPELIKFLDRKDERRHELAMFERQADLEKVRGQIRLEEVGAQRDMAVDTGVLDAFKSAIDQQTEMVKSAGGWVASLSASVRPVMTYYLLGLYGAYKTALIVLAPGNGWQAIISIYGPEDLAMLAGVINYWMLDRSLKQRGL
jgi:hypothetical protein